MSQKHSTCLNLSVLLAALTSCEISIASGAELAMDSAGLIFARRAGRIENEANRDEDEPGQELHVRIYDYAQVSPETLVEAKNVASSIFRKADVEVFWSRHSSDGHAVEAILNREPRSPKLQLRILNQLMAERLAGTKSMTGLTFQGTGGRPGKVANVFYHRVEELASSKTCSKGQILGHAAAHELGHLLLGSLNHSSTGLMKARLGHKDLQRAARGDLLFTESEAALVRHAIVKRVAEAKATQSAVEMPR